MLEKITNNIAITYQVGKHVLKIPTACPMSNNKVTTDAAGGMVSSRDFVYLYKIGEEGSSWVMGGKSTEYSEAPARGGIVRAVNGPGLMMVTPEQVSASDAGVWWSVSLSYVTLYCQDPDWCQVIWLMDCEYRGMMMQKILDLALPIAQTSYMECLRILAKDLKSQGKF